MGSSIKPQALGFAYDWKTPLCPVDLVIDLNRFRVLRQGITAVNEIEFTPRGAVLVRLNDTHHLD